MRNILLNKMRIENFKGIRSLEIDFNDKSTLISGYNGTCKSTIMDAYLWLMSGKNSTLETKFEVRPRDKDHNEIHNVITTTECKFNVYDDMPDNTKQYKTFVLRRDELEDLTDTERKHLNPETIAPKKCYYFIDEAPYDKKSFYDKVAELMCDKDKLMLLSNPNAFFRLKENEQREILIMACSATDSEIEGYNIVKEICGAVNTPIQVKEALCKSIRAIHKNIDEIPARVDSLSTLCDMYADYDKQITELEKKQSDIMVKLQTEQQKIDRLDMQLTQFPIEPSERAVQQLESQIDHTQNLIDNSFIQLQHAMERKGNNMCPNCGYIFHDNTAEIDKLAKDVEKFGNEIKELQKTLKIKKEEQSNKRKSYTDRLTQYNAVKESQAEKRAMIINRQAELHNAFTNLSVEIEKLRQAKKAQTQISQLNEKRCALDDLLADGLTKLDAINAFIVRKSEKIVESINKQFTKIKFKLFNMQTNGELKPCCKAIVNGVSYSNTNTASKVQAGIEIIKLLNEFYGVMSVLFVDDKESIIDLPPIDSQVVCMKVDEQYKELHIEEMQYGYISQ